MLLPGERVISELEPRGGGYFQLTHARVIYNGGGGTDGATAYASVQLKDISSIQISRRPRARRSAAWGVVGLFSAIGVWQVTPDSTIGIGAGAVWALRRGECTACTTAMQPPERRQGRDRPSACFRNSFLRLPAARPVEPLRTAR